MMRSRPQSRSLMRDEDQEKNDDEDLLLPYKKNRLSPSRRNTKNLPTGLTTPPLPLILVFIGCCLACCLLTAFLMLRGISSLDGHPLVDKSRRHGDLGTFNPRWYASTTRHGNKLQSRTTQQQQVDFVWHEGAIQLDAAFPLKRGGAIMEQPDSTGDDDAPKEEQPDYGGLDFVSIKHVSIYARRIKMRDREFHDLEIRDRDDFEDPPSHTEFETAEDEPRDCRRNNWAMTAKPTCNEIHGLTLGRVRNNARRNYQQAYKVKFLSKGSFRLTFLLENPDIEDDAMVLKPLLFHGHHDMIRFFRDQLYAIPMEVAILEGLTASPRITDIYGHCGFTTMQEMLPQEIETLLEPEGDRANQTELDIIQAVDGKVHPKNNLTAMEKLDLALGMAEAVADIHGFKGGVILHGDLHHAQFMKNRQGHVKLNDFNLGSILEWNDRDQKYCPREREPWCYECRAPEEMFGIPFDEKIDVFTFGNAIYAMLVGLDPWYDLPKIGKSKAVCKMVGNHERTFLDPRYRTRSSIETQLIAIMERTWEQEPEDRPDIFDVVKFLRNLKKEETDSTTTIQQIRKRVL